MGLSHNRRAAALIVAVLAALVTTSGAARPPPAAASRTSVQHRVGRAVPGWPRGSPHARLASTTAARVWRRRLAASVAGRGDDGGADADAAAVAAAYDAVLTAQAARPRAARTYVVSVPRSGWGNKVRAMVSALKLAIGTGRALLVDDDASAPLFPALFAPPRRPWLVSAVDRGAARGAPPPTSRTLYLRNAAANADFACWRSRKSLGACVPLNATARLLLETNQDVSGAVTGGRDTAAALGAALAAAGGGDLLADRRRLNRAAYRLLFGAPSATLARAVADAKSAVRWDAFDVRVGVHVRTFVDHRAWRVDDARVAAGFWACVNATVGAARAAAGGALAHRTLVYLATDKQGARPRFGAELRRATGAAVRWPPGGARKFVNTRDTRSPALARAVLAEWTLLSDADAVVGTRGSSFAAAAATRAGRAYAVGSLTGSACDAVGPIRGRGRGGGGARPPGTGTGANATGTAAHSAARPEAVAVPAG